MAEHEEELKLVVDLVDNASPGLDRIADKMKDGLGGPQMRNALESNRQHVGEVSKIVKQMGGGFEEVFKVVTSFRGGLAGLGGVVTTLGAAIIAMNAQMKKWGEELRGIGQAARAMGVNAAELKNMISQFEEVGVSAETTTEGVRKMSEAIADLNREGSEVAQALRQAAGMDPERQRNMESLINRLLAAKSAQEQYNIAARGYSKIIEEAEKTHDPRIIQERTDAANKAFAKLLDPRMVAARKSVTVMTNEERAIEEDRIKKGEELAKVWGNIHREVNEIKELLMTPMFDVAIAGANKLLEVITKIYDEMVRADKIDREHPAPEGFLQRLNPFNQQNIDREQRLRHPELFDDKGQRKVTENSEAVKKQTETMKNLTDAILSTYASPINYLQGTDTGGLVRTAGYNYGGGYGARGPYGSSVGSPQTSLFPGQPASKKLGVILGAPPEGVQRTPSSFYGSLSESEGSAIPGGWYDKGDVDKSGRPLPGYTGQDRSRPGVAIPFLESAGGAGKRAGDYIRIKNPKTGEWEITRQTDIGPNVFNPVSSKKGIDINAALAEQWGYAPSAKAAAATGREAYPSGQDIEWERIKTADLAKYMPGEAGRGGMVGRPMQEPEPAAVAGTATSTDISARARLPDDADWSKLNQPMGTVAPTTSAPTERVAAGIQNVLMAGGADPYMARHMGKGIVGAVQASPFGAPGAAADFMYHKKEGDIQAAALDVVGMLPGAKHASKLATATGGIAQAYAPSIWSTMQELNPIGTAQAEEARSNLAATQSGENKVTSDGTIRVDVNAPKGTRVSAEAGGLFKNTEINRRVPMGVGETESVVP
jgi:hypothetical protein